MATTLQNIDTPKRWRAWDTSGNNNHGQIYSGRGLEFDGVTDYLTYTTTGSLENFTISAWVNINSFSDINQLHSGGSAGLYPSIKATTGLVQWYNGSSWLEGSALNLNTWYRLVYTFSRNGSAGDYNIYINGVNTLSSTGTGTYTDGHFDEFGAINGADRLFNGMASDVQIWDKVWATDDITFDYANPEQLALNRGGTSLTESNLKLWYPMNDGHRGQQSYVFDASNTGLADVTSSLTSWSTGADVFETLTSSGLDVTSAINSSGNGRMITNSGITCATGDVFKITFDVTFNGGQIQGPKLKTGVSGSDLTTTLGFITESNSYTYYLNCIANGTGGLFFYTNNTSTDFSMNNIKVYRVNDKNHATTVFYGDEQITATNDREFGGAGNWTAYNSGTLNLNDEVAGTLKVTTDGGGAVMGAQLGIGEIDGAGGAHPIVAGRTYRVTAKLDDIGSNNDGVYEFYLGGGGGPVIATDGSPSDGTITTGNEEYYRDIVTQNTTNGLIVRITAATNDDAKVFTIDDVSVKEIGTAMGWTDADQQLDIPQTALQSYNQMLWFNGARINTSNASVVKIDDHNNIDVGTNDFSVSCWVYKNLSNNGDYEYILRKGGANALGWVLAFNDDDKFAVNISGSGSNNLWGYYNTAITAGEWNHFVATWDRDGTTKIYINGESVTVTGNSDISALSAVSINNSNNLYIGGDDDAPEKSFNGCVTEISFWKSHILSQSDVNELYNDGKALNVLEHSAYTANNARLAGYWRNNGLATWSNLKTPGTNDSTLQQSSETIIQQAGVDASRDCQGFLMNKQKDTNALNLPNNNYDAEGYVDLGGARSVAADTAFSMTLWLKPDDIADNRFFGDGNDYIRFRTNDDMRLYFGSSTYDLARNSGNFTKGEWVHIAFVRNTSNLVKMYIGGEVQTSTQTVNAAIDYRYIGANSDTNTFKGQIDDVMIYEGKEMSAAEVKRNYNAGKRSHK